MAWKNRHRLSYFFCPSFVAGTTIRYIAKLSGLKNPIVDTNIFAAYKPVQVRKVK